MAYVAVVVVHVPPLPHTAIATRHGLFQQSAPASDAPARLCSVAGAATARLEASAGGHAAQALTGGRRRVPSQGGRRRKRPEGHCRCRMP
jgi:hypothetical protein